MSDTRKFFPTPRPPNRRSDESPLAWCGWELPVPSAWRSIHIEGELDKGRISMGISMDAALQVKAWRSNSSSVEASTWLEQRSAAVGGPRSESAMSVESLRDSCFMPERPDPESGKPDVLCGDASQEDLMLEIPIEGGCDAGARLDVLNSGLPRLRITQPSETTRRSRQDDPRPVQMPWGGRSASCRAAHMRPDDPRHAQLLKIEGESAGPRRASDKTHAPIDMNWQRPRHRLED